MEETAGSAERLARVAEAASGPQQEMKQSILFISILWLQEQR